MNKILSIDGEIFDFSDKRHLITYAEEGFSPLSLHLEDLGYKKEEIRQLADKCNIQDKPKSLLPDFPVTLIPRRYIRERHNSTEFCEVVTQILIENSNKFFDDTVIFDLRTNETSIIIKRTIDRLFRENISRFKDLKNYGIVGWKSADETEHDQDFVRFERKINRVFEQKFFARLKEINNNLGFAKYRHWYQLAIESTDHLALQPSDAKTIFFELIQLSYQPEKGLDSFTRQRVSEFLSMLLVGNLLSQIVHQFGYTLKKTLSKNLLFPEIIGNCPGGCRFHLSPTSLPLAVVEEIEKRYGGDEAEKVRVEMYDGSKKLLNERHIWLKNVLTKLVVKDVNELQINEIENSTEWRLVN